MVLEQSEEKVTSLEDKLRNIQIRNKVQSFTRVYN